MKIIDNFISQTEQDDFVQYVSTPYFPYRLYSTHIYSGTEDLLHEHAPLQLSHFLYESESDQASPHLPIIAKFVRQLEKDYGKIKLLRAKVNLTSPHPPFMNYEHQTPHIDLQYDDGSSVDHKVFLYYINDSDGPTYFFNNQKKLTDTVYPKKGRAVIFDGSQIHAGSNPVKSPFRFVLNVDFKVS